MFEQAFKNIDDILWKEDGCTTELDYTEQTSWLLFLKYLDGLEQDKATEARLPFPPIAEQQVIVKTLNSLREATQNLEGIYQRKLVALDELKQSLLHQAFSGAL